jgi:hypothetical protein
MKMASNQQNDDDKASGRSGNQGGTQGSNQGGNQGGNQGSNQGSQGGSKQSGDTSNRGFASMDPDQQREIAAEGGRAAHASGNAHEFTSEEARKAGAMSHKNYGNQQSGSSQGSSRSGGQSGSSGSQSGSQSGSGSDSDSGSGSRSN